MYLHYIILYLWGNTQGHITGRACGLTQEQIKLSNYSCNTLVLDLWHNLFYGRLILWV